MTVSVPFSAQPEQVLDAFRRIQEEARKTGRELKSLGDVNFPGLESAKAELEFLQRGFQQLFAPAVRSGAAEALRSGARAGMYGQDIVSWMHGAQRQFPDPAALNRHIESVLAQSARVASYGEPGAGGGGWGGYAGPGMGAALGGIMQGNVGGVLGGIAGGAAGMAFGPAGSAIGGMLGGMVGGKIQGAVGKYADQSMQEAYGLTDLRRNVYAVNEEFRDFRAHIRSAGAGLGFMHNEVLAYAQSYAAVSGAMGGRDVSMGTAESLRMSRVLGMNPGATTNLMGRASWLGMNGGNVTEQSRTLVEMMVGSNLGAKQGEAAEAMLKFVEKNNQAIGTNGDIEAFKGLFLSLVNSSAPGVRTNAAGIIGGFDDAIRSGGRAGDAGKNFMWNVLSRNGVNDPLEMDYALEEGFTGKVGGKMIGPALIDAIRGMGGSNRMVTSRLKGLFGGSQHVAGQFLTEYDKWQKDPNRSDLGLQEKYESMMKDFGGGTEADALRKASADLNNAAQELMGDRMLGVMEGLRSVLGDLAGFLNKHFPGGHDWKPNTGGASDSWGAGSSGSWGGASGRGAGADPVFDSQVSSLAARYGIKYSAGMGADKKSHYTVTGGEGINAINFVAAVDKLIDKIGQQSNIEVNVQLDSQGRVVSKSVGKGGIPKPSHGGSARW